MTLPPVVKCRYCNRFFWLAGAKKVGEYGIRAEPGSGWDTAFEIDEPTEEEYHAALADNFAPTPSEEKTLRILAWWRHTGTLDSSMEALGRHLDSGRLPHEGKASEEAYRGNLLALLSLFDDCNENELLMRAEVFRNLGDFEASKATLKRIISREAKHVVAQIRLACDEHKTEVIKIKPPAPPPPIAPEQLSLSLDETIKLVCKMILTDKSVDPYIASEVRGNALCTTQRTHDQKDQFIHYTLPLRKIDLSPVKISHTVSGKKPYLSIPMIDYEEAITRLPEGYAGYSEFKSVSNQTFSFSEDEQAVIFWNTIAHLALLCGAPMPLSIDVQEIVSLNREEVAKYVCEMVVNGCKRYDCPFMEADVRNGVLYTTALNRHGNRIESELPLKLVNLGNLEINLERNPSSNALTHAVSVGTLGLDAISRRVISDTGELPDVSHHSHEGFEFLDKIRALKFRTAIEHLARLSGAPEAIDPYWRP